MKPLAYFLFWLLICPTIFATDESNIYQQSSKSVVLIKSNKGFGTGFFIEEGLILTNRHVITGNLVNGVWQSYPIYVELKNKVKIYEYDLIVCSKNSDLCAIKVNTTGNEFINPKGDFKPIVGEKVYTIGHPKGSTWTISSGIISTEPKIIAELNYQNQNTKMSILQFNAPISPGNSGGPLLNSEGLLIGVVTSSMIDSQNLNFAISLKEITLFLNQITNEEDDKLIFLPFNFQKNTNRSDFKEIQNPHRTKLSKPKTLQTQFIYKNFNGIILYDSTTKQPFEVPDLKSAIELISTNKAGFANDQEVPMYGPDGELYKVRGANANIYIFDKGYKLATQEDIRAKSLSNTYSNPTQQILTIIEQGTFGVTLGIGNLTFKKIIELVYGNETLKLYVKAERNRQEVNSNLSKISLIFGLLILIGIIFKIKKFLKIKKS